MFSSKKRQAQAAQAQARQEAALAGAGLGISSNSNTNSAVRTPPPPPPPSQARVRGHSRTTSASTAGLGVEKPLASPLQMTFDFELPASPALLTSNANATESERFGESVLAQPSERSVGLGLGVYAGRERKGSGRLEPPVLPPIPRVASNKSGAGQGEDGGVKTREDRTREERVVKPIIFGPIPNEREQVREKPKLSPSPPTTIQPRTSPPIPPREEIWDRVKPPQPQPPPPPASKEREDPDNLSTKSSGSRRSLNRIESFITFSDPAPDFLSSFNPSSASSPKIMSSSPTPKMESSLFPAREPSTTAAERVDTVPAMTRAMIDARDKPYSQRPPSQGKRPSAALQPAQSSPDLQAAGAFPTPITSGFGTPRAPPSATSPTTTFTRPSPQSAHTTPNFLRNSPTNYSGSTARSTTSSSQSTAVDPPTIGTPYQQTSPSFPLPQHVATRPKTAGAHSTATIQGVSIPTHHTSSSSFLRPETSSGPSKPDTTPAPKTEKSDRRKTRQFLNPLAMLSRRRSGQDDPVRASSNSTTSSLSRPTSTEQKAVIQAAQTAALQRQRNVAAVGVSRLPEDFDPRIRGKVVHDFSAPRRRQWGGYNDGGGEPAWNSVARGLQGANSAPLIPAALQEDEEAGSKPAVRQSITHSNKHTSDSSSGKKSFNTGGMFLEHLGDGDGHSQRIHAERLENKDFIQRVSRQSNVSQESAVLPPFARRSQVLDPSQAAFFHAGIVEDEEAKRGAGQRSSGVSEVSNVSPVTARSSAIASGANYNDARASFSPVSPTTPSEKRGSAGGRPVSEVSPPDSEAVRPPSSYFSLPGSKGPTFAVSPPENDSGVSMGVGSSAGSEGASTARQSTQLGTGDGDGEGTPRPPFAMPVPTPLPASRTPPVIPPRSASASPVVAVSPLPSSGPGSLLNSALPSPSLRSLPSTSNLPTPQGEPQVAETVVMGVKAAASPPKLVEKRSSAVGHAKRASAKSSTFPPTANGTGSGNVGVPKHHVSNASRFSFQFGGSAAEERMLEEKHRRIVSNDIGGGEMGGAGGGDGEEDDFFDEDAMDDLDEMEMQEQQEEQKVMGLGAEARKSVAQFMYRTPTTNTNNSRVSAAVASSAWEREKARLELQFQADDRDGVARSVSGSEGGQEDDEEGPYWMHEDFQGYEDDNRSERSEADILDGYHSREPSGSLPSSFGAVGQLSGGAAIGLRRRGESGTSLLTLDTNVGHGARSGFYMQPVAAGYSPTAKKAAVAEKPVLPHRQSGNSERNRVASGLEFSSPTLGAKHKAAQLSQGSTVSSSDVGGDEARPFSQSTVGGSSESEPRTLSTGLGLSGLSEFKFSDSAPSSRPMSLQTAPDGKENRRTKDSETIPRDVDWSGKPSPTLHARGSGGWSSEDHGLVYDGAVGQGLQARKPSTADVKQDLLDGEDDMYFDDGEFDQEVTTASTQGQDFGVGRVVDEDAFDDERVFKNINGAITRDQVKAQAQQGHQRDISALTITSLGSDGPYPSFAMPNPIKARQRDSRLLLEDLPLQAVGPIDPKLIPQRNPSEDAKRLGLSNKVPPLPVVPTSGNADAIERVQANLLAYHAALADAANKAAADGRFLRMPSGATEQMGRSLSVRSGEDGEGGVAHQVSRENGIQVSRENGTHVSRSEGANAPIGGVENGSLDRSESTETTQPGNDRGVSYDPPKLDYNPPRMSFDFGFDSLPTDDAGADDFDDFGNEDDIVAAANAEALASDDEGFYGQEFGFYAKARPNSGELQAVNGGFFGLDGDDGLMRNKSLKEPNLTPITERSEFSTRNSFISLSGPFGPPSAGPMSATSLNSVSPALARMPVLPLGENEVTSFDQLRKLRAHAFGGSNVSLHSDGKGHPGQMSSDSPTLSTRSAAGAQGYFGPLGGAPMSFGYSTDSSGSSNPPSAHAVQQYTGFHGYQDSPHSAASSGHLPFSMSMENEVTPKRPPRDSAEAPLTVRKVAASTAGKAQGHSRKSSKDSVTYIQEQDPAGTGQPRWVVERRRTSEQGQLELIAREIVQGGWI